jgi:aerobic carbon-monoxide dehydrogenase medium subunit
VIPAAFAYQRAGSVAEALALLEAPGGDAAVLAGGHSLLPMMKLRRTRPARLVDIGPCAGELGGIAVEGSEVVIGALVTHHALATSPLVAGQVPILAAAAALVGDPQVRRRGTVGGSLSHADPAADLPGVALALGATVVVAGPAGRRRVPAAEFFVARNRTAMAPGELLVEVRVPAVAGARWSYQRLTRRAADWPTVAVAAVDAPGCGVALVNMGETPLRATAVEAARATGATAAESARLAAEGTDPPGDLKASPAYRRHLAAVLTRRALVALQP